VELNIALFTVIKIRGFGGRQLRPDTLCHMGKVKIITGSHVLFSVLSVPYHDRPVQTYGVAHKTVRLILTCFFFYIHCSVHHCNSLK